MATLQTNNQSFLEFLTLGLWETDYGVEMLMVAVAYFMNTGSITHVTTPARRMDFSLHTIYSNLV